MHHMFMDGPKNPLKVQDNTLRDGHQSLLATRMRLEDMLPIAERMESIFIFIAGHPALQEEEKQILFQSLSAYQKIYRKFLELQDDIGDKDLISRNWFGEDYDQLKKQGEYRDSFSNLVTRFIDCLRQKNKKEALQVGRFLVLRNNNEN